MAFTRKALKARARVRKGVASDYVETLREGEIAFSKGIAIDCNPYPSATEENETWSEGWQDAQANA